MTSLTSPLRGALWLFYDVAGFVVRSVFRHPLQELCCSPFVPNNIQSSRQEGKMKILTGPNASGKSVYMKQVRSTENKDETLQLFAQLH